VDTENNQTTLTINYDTQTGKILKNQQNFTYIKPYTNLSDDMCIHFINNKYVNIIDSSDPPQIIKTTSNLIIKSVDKKFWKIEHDTLQNPLISATNNDTNTPYQYEIRSYFKASDENPFGLYDNPYLRLGAPNENDTDIDIYEDYLVVSSNPEPDYIAF
jgi:hypothetical protein